jgi:hypothetical protein
MIKTLLPAALLGFAGLATAAPVLFPNGNFDSGGADWAFSQANGHTVSYPADGGNPGGHAVIDGTAATQTWYAVLISNNDAPYPLSNIPLQAGKRYKFFYDMQTPTAGANKGGIKVESWTATGIISNSGEMRRTTTGTGWTTYEEEYTIDPAATHIKVVPLWTSNDIVRFDNIGVDNTPVAIVPVIPNSGFEAGGANWMFFGSGAPSVSYPASGGNPNGNAVINATSGGWGVIVANNNVPMSLASLGLTAGETYTFQLDMKVLAGPNPGGIKVEFVPGFSGERYYTPEQIAALPKPVTEWNTYQFEITLPPTCTQIQVVPLFGPSSSVAYDNVKILLPAPPAPLAAKIKQGTAVSWTPASATNQYQPQESADNSVWTNLGPVVNGNTVTSTFDGETSPFYRVLESVPVLKETEYNGSFAEPGAFADEADGWTFAQTQWPLRLATGGRIDDGACIQLKVLNVGAAPGGSEIQQNTKDADSLNPGAGAVTPGDTYTFSFWAKQISSGASYEQRYKISWLDDGGAIKGDSGWSAFSAAVGGDWTKFSKDNLLVPADATTALIQIVGVTGAVDGGLGEVLIDDVSLQAAGFGSPTTLVATATPAVEISWSSKTGKTYQVQSSPDLSTWTNFGGVISGDSTTKSVYDLMTLPAKFYKVGVLP